MIQLSVHPELQTFVADLAVQLPARGVHSPAGEYQVLPGPYPVLGCQYRGHLAVLNDGSPRSLFPAGVTGLQPDARWFRAERGTYSILMRLKPGGAASLLGVDMNGLAGVHAGLDQLGPPREALQLHEQLSEAPTIVDAANRLQRFLVERVARMRRLPHPAVVATAERILCNSWNVLIRDHARDAGISERQLERLFRLDVGVSPKEFASLCRFDWVVKNLAKHPSWADLAVAAGYSDQAHFIRSFTRRAGLTPAKFASKFGISS